MNKYILYLFIIICFCNTAQAQNASEDFAKVNANLLAAENLLMEIEYKVFANYFTQTPKEISYGVLKQKGNKMYQSIATLQALTSDKITLHLDTAEKVLVLSDPLKLSEHKKEAMMVDVKDILSKCKNVSYKQVTKTTGMYTLEYKDDILTEFDQCDLYIDKNTYYVSKMVLYYNEEIEVDENNPNGKKETPRLEINYTNINTKPNFKDSEFDEKLFIKRNGNKIVTAAKYNGFKIIDNRYYTRPTN